MAGEARRAPSRALVVAAALLLFSLWSNSFIAIGYLLGADGARPRFDWRELAGARFVVAALPALLYVLARRRAEAAHIAARHPLRLALCGLLSVPAYNFALYYGQEHGVPAPVASLLTALAPLSILVLSALFLGERLTRPKLLGFAVALLGLAVLSSARRVTAEAAYPWLIAITALAPLSWAVFTVLSKPMTRLHSPLVWTYLAIGAGTLLALPLLPFRLWPALRALDGAGWIALLFLSMLCTVLGFALWVWLLQHLDASSVGLTVFLNPPLTAGFKLLLAQLFPATFRFAVAPRELIGGVIVLSGLAVALRFGRTAPAPAPAGR